MVKSIRNYYEELKRLIDNIETWDRNKKELSLDKAISRVITKFINCRKAGKKLMFIGNGASASISSHQATDYWKTAGIKAMAFNDPALLTCISNDYGYQNVFKKPIEMFAEKGDILIAISSSGKSKNIINAARKAREKGCFVITMTGFSRQNILSAIGDINFYVSSASYSHVEIIHHSISHYILEMLFEKK